MVDTSDEWIVQRTGMRERRIAGEHEFVSDLATKAVEDMVRRYEVKITDVDMILLRQVRLSMLSQVRLHEFRQTWAFPTQECLI